MSFNGVNQKRLINTVLMEYARLRDINNGFPDLPLIASIQLENLLANAANLSLVHFQNKGQIAVQLVFRHFRLLVNCFGQTVHAQWILYDVHQNLTQEQISVLMLPQAPIYLHTAIDLAEKKRNLIFSSFSK